MTGCAPYPGLVLGTPTVPRDLIGAWTRRYIRFDDGISDLTTRVVWLQTLSGTADMRIAADRPSLKSRSCLAECTRDELLSLAGQDCYTGETTYEASTVPYATAKWPVDGYRIRYQPSIAFPEDGWMEWNADRTCIIERAPSGAYEEDWRLSKGSQTHAAHLVRKNESLHIAGNHVIFARDRAFKLPPAKSLLALVLSAGDDLEQVRRLVDCEFSYAQRSTADGDYTIRLSTFPWREGQQLDCRVLEHICSSDFRAAADLPDGWTLASFWRNPGPV